MSEELVDIVNEKDEVVGVATREEAHKQTLLHRLIEVWFYDRRGRVLLQKRSLQKTNLPGLLDFTVGGHVSSGESYEEGLLKEVREETGVLDSHEKFKLVKTFVPQTDGDVNDLRLHVRKTYLYLFEGDFEKLSFDAAEVAGFEWWDIDELVVTIQKNPELFVPFMKHRTTLEVLQKIKSYHNS